LNVTDCVSKLACCSVEKTIGETPKGPSSPNSSTVVCPKPVHASKPPINLLEGEENGHSYWANPGDPPSDQYRGHHDSHAPNFASHMSSHATSRFSPALTFEDRILTPFHMGRELLSPSPFPAWAPSPMPRFSPPPSNKYAHPQIAAQINPRDDSKTKNGEHHPQHSHSPHVYNKSFHPLHPFGPNYYSIPQDITPSVDRRSATPIHRPLSRNSVPYGYFQKVPHPIYNSFSHPYSGNPQAASSYDGASKYHPHMLPQSIPPHVKYPLETHTENLYQVIPSDSPHPKEVKIENHKIPVEGVHIVDRDGIQQTAQMGPAQSELIKPTEKHQAEVEYLPFPKRQRKMSQESNELSPKDVPESGSLEKTSLEAENGSMVGSSAQTQPAGQSFQVPPTSNKPSIQEQSAEEEQKSSKWHKERHREYSKAWRKKKKQEENSLKEEIEQLRKFRSLVEDAPDMLSLIAVEQNFPFIFASAAFERQVQIEGKDLVGQPFCSIVHPMDQTGLTHTLSQACAVADPPSVTYRVTNPCLKRIFLVESNFRRVSEGLIVVSTVRDAWNEEQANSSGSQQQYRVASQHLANDSNQAPDGQPQPHLPTQRVSANVYHSDLQSATPHPQQQHIGPHMQQPQNIGPHMEHPR